MCLARVSVYAIPVGVALTRALLSRALALALAFTLPLALSLALALPRARC
jgi:hypothetical protein